MRPVISRVADPPQMVSELIDSTNARWNSDLVNDIFLPYDSLAIFQIPICTQNIFYFWAWNYEKSGVFSVRSSYHMITMTKKRREDWLESREGSLDNSTTKKSWTSL